MVNPQHSAPRYGFSRGYTGAALALGFGLGGFFDGILLHQILQWHHLLSGVEEARLDIRLLIMADGAFHAVMYVISGIGLWLLWRNRHEFAQPGADRHAVIVALIGFGVWHIIDGVLSHWVLGIHRIRDDVDSPLLWDVGWLVVFGILPILWAWRLRVKNTGGPTLVSAPVALVLATLMAAPLAALPPSGQAEVVVLFRPGITEAEAFAGIVSAGGRVLGADPSGQVWSVNMGEDNAAPALLYRYGAMLVSNSMLPLGCFSWTQA